MRYVALAAGFDGTLARDGRCDERCIETLRALAATGRKLILVTGRELRELLEIFPEARMFDYVVAENGAVMHRPATRESEILAQAPPELLLQELRRRHVTPLTVGSSIVRTVQANEAEVSAALRKLQLDFQLVTNPGALMMLPAGVNKASGVWAALRELGVSRHNLVAIGDGENDLALFEFAGHAVAVQNADPLVQRVANRTTEGAYCDGFLELARDLIATDLADAVPRHKFGIGVREDGAVIEITPCRDSVIVCGPAGSGKAALRNRLLEQFLASSYQCCIIDAEAGGLQVPGEVEVFGDAHEVPRLTDILGALDQPTASVAINLAGLAVETRPVFTDALLVQLQALHDRLGRPHVVVIGQADSFLTDGVAAASARLSEVTMIYSTPEPERLPARILNSVTLTLNSATQAVTAGGAEARICAPAPGCSGSDSLPESDAATVSGY
jgi:hydroxymethylpyrimidine pyrophosphatase-like HAD family hydrolase